MKKIFHNSKFVFVAFLTIILSACSGGGGGGGGGQPPPDTHVNGSIIKGVIKYATVNIYAIRNGQIETDPMVEPISTDEFGKYSFTLPADYSGPVKIVMQDNDQKSAKIKCDVPNSLGGCAVGYAFGQDMPLGDVVLSTYVSNVSGGSSHTASITPLTLLAAAYLDKLVDLGQAQYNAQGIANANSQVGNLLSINNIVTTTPPDITDTGAASADSNSLKYALLSAAITEMAQQDPYQGNILAVIDTLVESFTTPAHEGQLLNSDGGDTNTVSLVDLLGSAGMLSSALSSEFTYGGNVTSELSNLLMIAQSDTDEWTSAEPSPTSGMGELETVKAFVADARTWGHVIDEQINANTGDLQQRLDMAGTTLDIVTPLLSEAFDYAVNAALEAYVQGQDIDLSTYSPDPLNPVSATGTATISGDTVTVIGALNGSTFNVVMVFPNTLVGTEFTLSMTSATVGNSDAEIVVTQPGSVTLNYADTYPQGIDLSALQSDSSASVPGPDSGSLDLTVTINELNVTDAVSFEGALQMSIVGSKGDSASVIRDVTGEVVYYNPGSASLSGSFSSGTNTVTASASATMPNAETFMPSDYWYPGIGSYSFTDSNTLVMVALDYTRTITYNSDQTVTVFDDTPYYQWEYPANGTYGSLDAFLDSGDYAVQNFWTYIAGTGGYDILVPDKSSDWNHNLAGGTLDGVLADPEIPEETASNFRQISNVSVSFNAQLDNLPAATFTLTGNRTGLEDGSLDLNIAYGSRSIHATGNVAQGNAAGTVTITNQDGVVLTIDLDGVAKTGSVKYDQTEYATIENVRGVDVIRYIDGYFETF